MALGQHIQLDFLTNVNQAIKNINKLQKESVDSLKSIDKQAKRSSKTLESTASGLKKVGIAIAGIFAARKITQGFEAIIRESVNLENALVGLNAVAAATGQNVDEVTNAAKELSSDGLIPLSQTSAALKNLLASGLDAEQAVNTFKALRDAAAFNRQGTLSLGEAIEGATQGIKNQNSIMIDNAGITKNLSVLYKEYAASIGKTVGQLDDAEKSQAAYVGILKEAQLFQGNYNMLLQTFSGAVSKVGGNWKFLLADLGKFITSSPLIVAAIDAFGEMLKTLRKFINENRGAVEDFAITILKSLVVVIEFTEKAFDKLAKAIVAVAVAFVILKPGIIAAGFSYIASTITNVIALVGVLKLKYITTMTAMKLATAAFQAVLTLGVSVAIYALIEAATTLRERFGSWGAALQAVGKYAEIVLNSVLIIFHKIKRAIGTFIQDSINMLVDKAGPLLDKIGIKLNKVFFSKSLDESLVKINEYQEEIAALEAEIAKMAETTKNQNVPATDSMTDSIKNMIAILENAKKKAKLKVDTQGSEDKIKALKLNIKNIFADPIDFIVSNKGVTDMFKVAYKSTKNFFSNLAKGDDAQSAFGKLQVGLGNAIKLGMSVGKEGLAALGAGAFSAITSGVEGAKALIKGAAKAIGTAFGGKVGGQIAEQIIGPLMAAPEDFAKQIKDFFKALPKLIGNIIENLFKFDEILAEGMLLFIENLPDFVERMATVIIEKFADVTFWFRMGVAFVEAIIKAAVNLPAAFARGVRDGVLNGFKMAKGFFSKVFDVGKIIFDSLMKAFTAVPNFLMKLFKFDGGGKGPVEKFLHFDFPFVAFARGGMVPGKAMFSGDSKKNDTIPAFLSPGEAVVPRTAIQKGAPGIAEFFQKLGVPGFGLGKLVSSIFGGAAGWVADAFDSAFGSSAGIFRPLASVMSGIYGGNPLGFIDELEKLSTSALGLFQDITSSIGLPIDKLLGLGLPKAVIAALNSLIKLGANIDITDMIKAILKDPFGFIGNVVKQILPVFRDNFRQMMKAGVGLQTGGLIPSGFPNDSFHARLSSGEFVVNNALTPKLESFLDGAGQGGYGEQLDTNNTLLAQLIDIMERPQELATSVVLNENELARAILEINRSNQRLA